MASAAGLGGEEVLRYSRVAMWLHWLIAALLVVNLLLGFFYDEFGKPATPWLMWFHKSIGITILALTLVRLGWRLTHRPPPFDAVMKRWEAGLARLIHGLFYVALLVVPLTGWAASSAAGREPSWFGLFNVGLLPVASGDDSYEFFEDAHELLAKLTIGLVFLHVAGALKHHFEGHRHLIGRMAPWFYRGGGDR